VLFLLVHVNRIIHRTRISPFEIWHVGFSLDGLVLNKSIYANCIQHTSYVGHPEGFFGVRRRPIQANSRRGERRGRKAKEDGIDHPAHILDRHLLTDGRADRSSMKIRR
jgi:hypothetical protein